MARQLDNSFVRFSQHQQTAPLTGLSVTIGVCLASGVILAIFLRTWPFVALFAVSALLVSILVGKRGRRTRAKDTAYECGMIPQGEPQPRFSVKFYVVAMLFILFDLEIVFMYPWAVVYRDAIKQGSTIFWSMLSFITILMVGYVYALKKGALDFRK